MNNALKPKQRSGNSRCFYFLSRSHDENGPVTLSIGNQVYLEEPTMVYKRQSESKGPTRKIQKIVHVVSDARQLQRIRRVSQLLIARGGPYHVDIAPNVPRNQPRPRPIRPVGR